MATKETLEPLQNGQFGWKIKNSQNMRKKTLLAHYSCSMQKKAPKNTLYWRDDTSLKIGKNGR